MVTRYEAFANELAERLTGANTPVMRADETSRVAGALWQRAVADSAGQLADDRALYWGRLALRVALRETLNAPSQRAELETLLLLLEERSRGFADVDFPDDGTRKILITGFDPFQLDQNVSQSNPSGLAALMLDGRVINNGAVQATIQAAIMPVRFRDFDEGIVENFLTPHFLPLNGALDLMVTISMGRSGFDLERFPGLRRSASASDNQNITTGASSENPLVPHLGADPLDGPEFVEFSLPASVMVKVSGDWFTTDNRRVRTLERGWFVAEELSELSNQTAVDGSGGGYLSNEISYRSILLHRRHMAEFPIGHIHTPRVAGFDPALEQKIVTQIRQLLIRALEPRHL